jgi:hypothetical protein
MSESWPDGTSLLHVLPSTDPHGEVLIVGTESALRRLRDAVQAALDNEAGLAPGVMTRDGEGYWCAVVRASAADMETVPLHYADGMLFQDRDVPDFALRALRALEQLVAAELARRAQGPPPPD